MNLLKPSINLMTQDQIKKVHQDALFILKDIGIKVDDKCAIKKFKSHSGCSTKGNTIRISDDIVEWAINAAPASINVYDRLGRMAFVLDSEQDADARFGVGVTNLHFQDPEKKEILPFFRHHMGKAAGLCENLDHFDFISTPGVIQDLPPKTADLYGVIDILANTAKPFVMLVSDWNGFEPALELCRHIAGDITHKPFIIPYVNPITPLVLNAETTMKMDAAIHRGLPFIFSNYGMSGATCPITPAGTLALLLAELLSGLVYSQLVKEGTPIILGSLPAAFDMKNAGSYYSPQSMLLNLACARMMKSYGIPHCGTSGCTNGWGADILASAPLAFNHLTSCIGYGGMVPFVGSCFDSLVFSPELVVFSDDLISQVRQFSLGFDISDTAVGFENISSIGPGGNFLMSGLTAKYFRSSQFSSTIWPFLTLDQWKKRQGPSAAKLLREKTCHLLNHLNTPDDSKDIIERGEFYLKENCRNI